MSVCQYFSDWSKSESENYWPSFLQEREIQLLG